MAREDTVSKSPKKDQCERHEKTPTHGRSDSIPERRIASPCRLVSNTIARFTIYIQGSQTQRFVNLCCENEAITCYQLEVHL